MKIEELKTEEDMNSIKTGDVLICEWRYAVRDNDGENKRFISHHTVAEIIGNLGEVILDVPNNTYFSKSRFLEGKSGLKAVCRACA